MKKYFFVLLVIVFGVSGCGEVTTVSDVQTVPTSTQIRPPFSLDLKNETFQYINSEYKFSLEYSKSWDVREIQDISFIYGGSFEKLYSFSLTDTSTLPPNADISGLEIAITKRSFPEMVKLVEDVDRLPNGETISEVGDVEDVMIDNVAAKKGTNGTGIGLPESFYFIPLPNQNKSLWITYYSFETSTINTVETIISSLKLN